MTDRTDAFDGDNGLEELDRHARAATEALLAQVNELVELGVEPDWSGGTPPAAMPAGSRVDEAVMDAHERNVIPLGHARGRPGAAGRRRFAVGCAAAVVALVAVGGALAVVDGDGGPDVRSGGPESVLLPGWLPDGFQPVMAVDLGSADLPGGLGGEIAIYGDPDATEPWASTLAVTRFSIPEEMAGDWQPNVGEPVTVAGHDAALSEIDGLDSGSRGPGWQVQWPVEDGMLAVAGTNMTRDEVLAAAMMSATARASPLKACRQGSPSWRAARSTPQPRALGSRIPRRVWRSRTVCQLRATTGRRWCRSSSDPRRRPPSTC